MSADRVQAVRWLEGLRPARGGLPDEVVDAVDAALGARQGAALAGGDHVELLWVAGRAVRVNLFLDRDGTLWVEGLAAE
jgi:hypothetical protein